MTLQQQQERISETSFLEANDTEEDDARPSNTLLVGPPADGRHSPVTTTTVELSASTDHVEETYSLAELMPPDMRQIPEFEEILNMLPRLTEDVPLKLYDVPDVSAMFNGAMSRVKNSFCLNTVLLELQNVYQVLAITKTNEDSLKKKLKDKEDEIAEMHTRMRRDPRLYRALVLASEWRQEKNIEAQTAEEYKAALEAMKSDMKDLETKIHNLQNVNARIHKDLHKIHDYEEAVRSLEEGVLKRDNLITFLEAQIETLMKTVRDSQQSGDSLKSFKAHMESSSLQAQKEIERTYKHRISALRDDFRREINELNLALEKSRKDEMSASHNFKSIVKTVRSMKQQLKTLESTVESSHRHNAHLTEEKKQCGQKIADLEAQVRKMHFKEEDLYKQLLTQNNENERLKALLGSLGSVGKIQSQSDSLIKYFRDKEREIATCSKNEHRLEKELKLINIQLGESKRLRENQQRDLNSNKQLVTVSKQGLSEALRYNDVLSKRLEWTEAYLKFYQRRFDACTGEGIDIKNTLKYLESLCKEHELTIRIKDSQNDSLVLTLSNLEDMLTDAYSNIHNLRQANLMSQTNHLRQMELNDMMGQLLKFTEAEKIAAVNECNKNVDTVLLLQKQLVQRMNRIASQYKDLCDLRATIQKHLQMLELQKNEANALREVLTKFRDEDMMKTKKLHTLTQERDAFGAVVVEKNIIIQLLEKKIALLEIIIQRGTTDYRYRTDDILLLKAEIRNLRHKMAAKETTEELNSELRLELVQACRQLQKEQNKRKAIEDFKATQPHRFITMKCRDPSQYEQLTKIHKLQRLLIAKHNELTNKEEIIISRDMEIKKIKLFHMRRAGTEQLQEQFREATLLLRQKNKQIKGLISEVNILRFEVTESRKEFNQALAELNDAKDQIRKQRHHAVKDSSQNASTTADLNMKPKIQKGGFSVEFCRPQFRLQPLDYSLQRQRPNRTGRQLRHTRRISDKPSQFLSRSFDLPSQ